MFSTCFVESTAGVGEGARTGFANLVTDWADYTIAIPAFVTMVMMPFTYSITNGIGMGFITFVVLRLAAGRGREVPAATYVVAAVFGFSYLMPALGLT